MSRWLPRSVTTRCTSWGCTPTSTSTSLGRWWPGPACRPTWSATNGRADSPADVHGGQLHAAVSGEPGGLLLDVSAQTRGRPPPEVHLQPKPRPRSARPPGTGDLTVDKDSARPT